MDDKTLSPDQREALLATLQGRFEKATHRHPGLAWIQVLAHLEAHPESLWPLHEMERTGGEPDVVGYNADQKKPEKDRLGVLAVFLAKSPYPGMNSRCEARPHRSR